MGFFGGAGGCSTFVSYPLFFFSFCICILPALCSYLYAFPVYYSTTFPFGHFNRGMRHDELRCGSSLRRPNRVPSNQDRWIHKETSYRYTVYARPCPAHRFYIDDCYHRDRIDIYRDWSRLFGATVGPRFSDVLGLVPVHY